jgi:hypothetical protein
VKAFLDRVRRGIFARGRAADDGCVTSRFRHAQTGNDNDPHDRVISDISAGLVGPLRLRRVGTRCKALRKRNYFA